MGASLIPRPPSTVKGWLNLSRWNRVLWLGNFASWVLALGAGNPMPSLL